MALVDDIEYFGRAAESGELTRDEAIKQLAAASEGGLTELGAAHLITNWKTARNSYERIYFDTHDSLRALEEGRPLPKR